MNITLVGAGNLATNLGLALVQNGHHVRQIYSRTIASARTLATCLQTDFFTNRMSELDGASDIYILSVKDDALPSVAAEIQRQLPTKLMVHTAGTLPLDTLRVEHRGVFYPMQTFSKNRPVPFTDIPCFIEAADPDDLQTLLTLARSISNTVYEMSSEERKYLHLAAVFCCNFANHCSTLASRILEKHGIPFNVMLPLIDETTRKLHLIAPAAAQTGPAARNDQMVMNRQIATLADEDEKLMAAIYRLMSQSIHETQLSQPI